MTRSVPGALTALLLTTSPLLAQHITVPGVGWEGAGAGMAVTNLDSNSRPDVIMMAYDDPSRGNTFRYRVGKNMGINGTVATWSNYISVPGVGWEGQGAGVAIGNIGGTGRPDMIMMAYDNPSRGNTFRYRVGRDLNTNGVASSWSSYISVPGVGWEGAGADVALVNLDGNPRPEMIMMAYDDPARGNSFRYRVGYNLNSSGVATHWSSYRSVAGVGWEGQGAGIAIGNFGGGPRPDMVMMAYDNPARSNTFRYRIGMDLNVSGVATSWSNPHTTEPGVGWEGQGAGVAAVDLRNDGQLDLLMMAYDNPSRGNTFRYRVVPDFAEWNNVVNLTVSRHNSVSINAARVDQIFDDASEVLQEHDGPGDTACNVELRRAGSVGVFNVTDGSLDNAFELATVFALPGNVKVVDDVNWCANQFNSSYIGCGQTPGTSFITERFTTSLEGILWAHEYGHNTGLGHNSSSNFVMFRSIGASRERVTGGECTSFGGTSPAMGMASLADEHAHETHDDDGAVTRFASTDFLRVADNLPPVEEFVTQIYFEGLPLDVAAEYGPQDAEILAAMLEDPSLVTYHENIALTLGMIGEAESSEALIAYVQQGGIDSPETRRAYKGVVGAVMGLGYIASQSEDTASVDFLIGKARDTGASGEISRFAPAAGGSTETLSAELRKYALISLGLSGRPEAAGFLQEVQSDAGAQLTGSAADLSDVIEQSLELNSTVAREGIVDYYKQ